MRAETVANAFGAVMERFGAEKRARWYICDASCGAPIDVISSDVMIMGKTDHGQLPIHHILFSHSDLLERVPFEPPCRLPSISALAETAY